MNTFNFIPAIKWSEITDVNNIPIITFFGASGHYFKYNNVLYFLWDGCHVATKNKSKISYNSNPDIHLPVGFKSAIKKVKLSTSMNYYTV
jgi:hypothetical protein